VGFFLVLIGLLFVISPNLYGNIITFFSNFNVTSPVPNTSIMLPAPDFTRAATNSTVREANLAVYSAAMQFSLAWGVFLVALLVIRFAANSPTRKKAENLGNIVFWFGTAYLVQTWLIEKVSSTTDATVQTQRWFEFWPLILMLLGASLIVRAIFLAAVRLTRI
jgi:hypothetical protein